ncbi:MAG: hypothetical protein AAGI44_08555 [Pseudomonadota bacterium]
MGNRASSLPSGADRSFHPYGGWRIFTVLMHIVLTLLKGLFAACLAMALLFFYRLYLHGEGLMGHSSHFDHLDQNGDAEVTYVEWMAYYGPHAHPIGNCSRKDFYFADCDQNDRLTWREYHNKRMKRRSCLPSEPNSSERYFREIRTNADIHFRNRALLAMENELKRRYDID